MAKADRHRAKMLRGLVRALDNEESHVRRYSLIGKACGALGGLVFALSFLAANDAADVWLVVSGVAASILMGLAVFYISSVEQWPVTREFLNVDEIREAARRHEL